MPMSGEVRTIKPNVRFGAFEVSFERGELRKHGLPIPLQEQPFRLLCLLLEHAGQLVTREELRAEIWPANTFVDYDGSLNIAVLKVRHALGDSASRPRFIETVPRRGYRFVAALEQVAPPTANTSARAKGSTPSADDRASRSSGRLRAFGPWIAAAILAGTFASVLSYRLVQQTATAPAALVPVPLTALTGVERDPSLSPDGTNVVFTWNGEKQDNFDIYVASMPMRSGAPVRVTANPAHDFSPVWSPDGQKIAFVRQSNGYRGELLVVPAAGGPEHKIADICSREIGLMRLVSLSWSPDGQWIAASHREPGDKAESLYAFSIAGERRRFFTPPEDYHGDYMPAFSPDGSALAFCRLAGFSTSEIFLVALDRSLLPKGSPRAVTTGKRWSVNPVWVGDGSKLLYVFSEHPDARHQLQIIDVLESASAPRTLQIPDEPRQISRGAHLVYSRRRFDTNIWRVRISGRRDLPAVPERFISTTRDDEKPSYSPNGQTIAFVSKRSGSDEIWMANADGSNQTRMTHFGGPLVGAMNWSPDGQWLVFHARPEGHADIFRLAVAGGSPVRLTNHPADEFMPSYSRDGRWIYFGSRRSGDYAIWKIPSSGGDAIQLIGGKGSKPVESMDGKRVYYHSWPAPDAILSVPSGGGDPVEVIGTIHPYPLAFVVTAEGIYYPAPPHSGDNRYIRFFRFSTRESHPVALVNRPFRLGMSISPDGQFLAYDQVDESGSDLMVVQDFKLP